MENAAAGALSRSVPEIWMVIVGLRRQRGKRSPAKDAVSGGTANPLNREAALLHEGSTQHQDGSVFATEDLNVV